MSNTSEQHPNERGTRPPVRAGMLDYARVPPTRSEKRWRYVQFAAGLAVPNLYWAAVAAWSLNTALPLSQAGTVALLAVGLFTVGVACVDLLTPWKSFLAGVLAGLLGIPLVFTVMCSVS